MSNIIHLHNLNNELRADSRLIAKRLGIQHKNSMELIQRYADKFHRHGLLPFETEAVKQGGARGVKRSRFALLNEDQCHFLLSLSRNTPRVVDLKSDLVSAFGDARRRGQAQQLGLWQQLMALEVEDKSSSAKGRFGSRLMNERKVDLRHLRPRRSALNQLIQPQLAFTS